MSSEILSVLEYLEKEKGIPRADMIATAKDIQDQEHSLTILENRVGELQRDAAAESRQAIPVMPRRDRSLVGPKHGVIACGGHQDSSSSTLR